MNATLNEMVAGNVDRKVEAMSKIIYNIELDRFGEVEGRKVKTVVKKNRREIEISKIRQDLKNLTKASKAAIDDEKPALSELRRVTRERLKV